MSPFVMHLTGIVIADVSGDTEDTAVSTHTLTLPAGATAGDVVYFIWGHAGGSQTMTPPSGWTRTDHGNSRRISLHRKLDGTEGSTITVTTSGDVRSGFIGWRFTGAHGDVQIADASAGPPLVTPAWGSARTAWLTWAVTRRTDNEFTAPANYEDQIDTVTDQVIGNIAYQRLSAASRILEAESEQPGAWGVTGTLDDERYGTVAVRPAA